MNDRTDPILLEPAAWLDALNPAQSAAAGWGKSAPDGRFRAGPHLAIAAAGTGKTATLAHPAPHHGLAGVDPARSDTRRVGKERGSTCRLSGRPSHNTQKNMIENKMK